MITIAQVLAMTYLEYVLFRRNMIIVDGGIVKIYRNNGVLKIYPCGTRHFIKYSLTK